MSEQELKVKALEAAAQTCHDFHDMMLKAKEIFTWLTSEACAEKPFQQLP